MNDLAYFGRVLSILILIFADICVLIGVFIDFYPVYTSKQEIVRLVYLAFHALAILGFFIWSWIY